MDLEDVVPGVPLPPRPPPPAPLLPGAIGLIAGIAADNAWQLPTSASAGLLAIGTLVFFRWRTSRALAFLAIVFVGAAVGSLRHAVADRWLTDNHIVRYTDPDPMIAHVTGRILTPPRVDVPREDIPHAYELGPKTRFVMETMSLAGKHGPVSASGRMAVTVKGVVLSRQAGDVVEMTGWLYRPRGPRNPGEIDFAEQNRRAGIRVGFACDHAESVRLVRNGAQDAWQAWLDRARVRLHGYLIDDGFDDSDPGVGVISAMVLGERSAVSQAINEAFVRTGNAHFLAASGMNVAWLALVGWGFMRVIGAHYRTTATVTAFLIASYVLLAEPEPSILRAGIMGLLGCLSVFLRGRSNVVNWLACSAIVVLMIDPMDAFRAGFQLSFVAVLATLHLSLLVRRAISRLGGKGRRLVDFEEETIVQSVGSPYATQLIVGELSWPRRIAHWTLKASLLSVSVSIACWMATLPLACYHFNQFTPWGWLGTLILWLPAFVATLLGYIIVVLRLLLPSLGLLLGPALAWTTHAMLAIVQFLAKWPGTLLDGHSPSLAWVIACYTLLWLRVYRPDWLVMRPRGLNVRAFPLAVVLLIAWWLVPVRWVRSDRGALNVWFLAVGDGSGTVIEMPDGQTLVFDLGTRSPFDAGSVGVGFLKTRGITRIDSVFVSHADFDHFSGIQRLAREIAVGRVVINDEFERFASEKSSPGHFLKALHDAGIPVETMRGPQRFAGMGDVTVESIWPPSIEEKKFSDANDTSTVLRLAYQGRSVLLTGDIAEPAIASLLSDSPLKADVLALPHHGSVVRDTGRFIAAADPRIAIRSTGQPRRLSTNGVEQLVAPRTYFTTADDGCIRVRIKNGQVSAEAVMPRP